MQSPPSITVSGPLYVLGAIVQIEVEYRVYDAPEIEDVCIIGVYNKGDNVQRQDYTSLNTTITLSISEMSQNQVLKIEEMVDDDWAAQNLDADY